jgi:cytochrome c oxidase subunit 2
MAPSRSGTLPPVASLRRYARLASLPALAVALTSCGDLGMPSPATREGRHVESLWHLFLVVAGIVGAIVCGLLVYVLVRYRSRNDDVPDQNPYNIPIEILYTVLPILIVIGLFSASWFTQRDVVRDVVRPDLTVDVKGFQWQWQFRYQDTPVVITGDPAQENPELVLPLGRTVRLNLEALDVNHAFWVPEFLEKRDLIPGIDNHIDVTPTEAGSFVGRCAEFCGLDHWRMGFMVTVLPGDEFDRWLADHSAGAGTSSDERSGGALSSSGTDQGSGP